MLASCESQAYRLDLKTVYQCENHSLVISAYGNYPKGQAATIEVYKDANLNKQFDENDRMQKHTALVMLRSEELQILEPMKLNEAWDNRYIFVVLKAGSDSMVSTIAECKETKNTLD